MLGFGFLQLSEPITVPSGAAGKSCSLLMMAHQKHAQPIFPVCVVKGGRQEKESSSWF